jgi:hypothetical protein
MRSAGARKLFGQAQDGSSLQQSAASMMPIEEADRIPRALQTLVSVWQVTFDIASDMSVWTMASTHMASRHLQVDSAVVQNRYISC